MQQCLSIGVSALVALTAAHRAAAQPTVQGSDGPPSSPARQDPLNRQQGVGRGGHSADGLV